MHIKQRIDDTLAIAGETDIEIAAAQRSNPPSGRRHALCHV
jgi:hypothetical protein